MKFVQVFNEEIDVPDDIQSVSLLNEAEIVILTCKGDVMLYSYITRKLEKLFETNPAHGPCYLDGGFDPSAPSSIYAMDDIVVVVNDYKKHGFVLNRKENYLVHFNREDHYAQVSKYPIALFKNEENEPHLIFSVAWNHIQIVNLNTRQIITADKSLIEENVEERYRNYYKLYEQGNKLFWPSQYDYFFGKLIISPDSKRFLSAGWIWGSQDCCKIYEIEDFIVNHRIKDSTIARWEHNDRSICFVDNETIAALANPYIDEEEEASKDDPYEIRLYHADGQGEKSRIILKNSLDLSEAELYYCQSDQCFLVFSEKIGVTMISATGEIVYQERSFIPKQYNEFYQQAISYDKKLLSVYHLR